MKNDPHFPWFLAIIVPALAGLGMVALGMLLLKTYGLTLFLGVPFLVSFLSALILRRITSASLSDCYRASLLALTLLLLGIIGLAIDGLICILMALPLAAMLGFLGAWLGYLLGRRLASKAARVVPLIGILTLPLFMAFEQKFEPEPTLHTVISSVVIDAPIETVWREVIAFDRITAPPTGIFRLGIAYPIEAKIAGTGVGAVRHCIFSTGPFVEPITKWDPPRALEFRVTENPVPLNEWSIWPYVAAPHLHGTFESQKGQFHLREENGRTILEGTTWYHQRIAPDWYWHRISDYLIHQIHFRVLDHIKACAERKTLAQNSPHIQTP